MIACQACLRVDVVHTSNVGGALEALHDATKGAKSSSIVARDGIQTKKMLILTKETNRSWQENPTVTSLRQGHQ